MHGPRAPACRTIRLGGIGDGRALASHPDQGRAALLVASGGPERRVLGILVKERRDGAARSVSLNACCNGLRYKPKRLITGGFRSYGFAQRAILPGIRHRTSRYLNNRAENSH